MSRGFKKIADGSSTETLLLVQFTYIYIYYIDLIYNIFYYYFFRERTKINEAELKVKGDRDPSDGLFEISPMRCIEFCFETLLKCQ